MFQWKVLAFPYEDLSLGPWSHISDSQLPLTPAWRELTLSFEFQRYLHICGYTHYETHRHPYIYIHTNEKPFTSKNSILSNILLALFQGPLYNSGTLAFQYNFWIFKQLFQVLYIINKLLYNHNSNLKSQNVCKWRLNMYNILTLVYNILTLCGSATEVQKLR